MPVRRVLRMLSQGANITGDQCDQLVHIPMPEQMRQADDEFGGSGRRVQKV